MTMNKNADRSLILDSMPVKQALIRLAVPSILASMVTTIYNIADTFFIGQLHNTAMIAATTVAMPIMMLTHAFGESIGVSAGSYISRQLGAGHRDQVSRIVQTTMTLVVGNVRSGRRRHDVCGAVCDDFTGLCVFADHQADDRPSVKSGGRREFSHGRDLCRGGGESDP